MRLKHLLHVLWMGWCVSSFSQMSVVRLVDDKQQPLSFYKISVEGVDYLSNILGEIQLDSAAKKKLQLGAHQAGVSDTLRGFSHAINTKLNHTSVETSRLINQIYRARRSFELTQYAPYSYTASNKFYITSNEMAKGATLLNKLLERTKLRVNSVEKDRHLVLTESVSERDYLDPLNEKEIVKWSKFSGIDNSLFFSLNSQLQTTDIYQEYLKIVSTKCVNPLHRAAHSGYQYLIKDTLRIGTDQFAQVFFYPKTFSRFESIKGFVWVNLLDYSILALHAQPYYSRKMESSYSVMFIKTKGQNIPKNIRTSLVLDNVSSANLQIVATQLTQISGFRSPVILIKKEFSDLALDYQLNERDSTKRTIELTPKDSNTYDFFAKKTDLKISRTLKWGERFYFGQVHTKYFEVHLPELITYNEYEKLRLGLKLSTNETLLKKTTFTGKLAYGFGDQDFKAGFGVHQVLLDNHRLELKLHYDDDLYEAGRLDRTLVNRFNNSEITRQFRLQFFDRQQGWHLSAYTRPMRYLTAQMTLSSYQNTPKYTYQYRQENEPFEIRELKLNIRYAFGERYFRFYNERISFKTQYPIVWLTLEKSLANSDFDYTRYQLRLRYTKNFILHGTSKIELVAGQFFGDLPYFKLFNGLGAGSLSAESKGAFETMDYNEFAADQYAVLFFTHDFGYFNYSKNKTFRPKLETSFNYGIGQLSNQNDHTGIAVRPFGRGYAEAGVAINDLLLLYPGGVKIGLGVSFYHRLFYYRRDTFRENSIFKLALNFLI